MKFKCLIILFFIVSFVHNRSFGQIQGLYVETYYISDSNDATDTTGGILQPGSKTYRVYIDLLPGSKVQKIYGDTNHLLKFSSTAQFFNNIADGQTFGKDFSKNRLYENTVALDSWLTISQVTKSSGKIVGIPKHDDEDGSFIGGLNNDGGSAAISSGLLTNSNPLAGIPVTISDGNDTMTIAPGYLSDYGFISGNGDDSTVFGSLAALSSYSCNDCGLLYSPVEGADPDSNFILLAQLTTTGDIQFELNLEVIDTSGVLIKYVADDTFLLPGEVANRILKYPYVSICGCPDINYLEYLADRDCDDLNACQNVITFGCLDSLACNYDPTTNVHVQSLCCYPGKCNDRDLAFVCPQMVSERSLEEFDLFPNPAVDQLNIQLPGVYDQISYSIFNALGLKIVDKQIDKQSSLIQIDIKNLDNGIYFIHLNNGNSNSNKVFIKN